MKRIFLLLLTTLPLVMPQAGAQLSLTVTNLNASLKADSIDRQLLRVQYEMTYLQDTIKPDAKPVHETMRLDAGNRCSRYYSYNAYLCDSINRTASQSGASQESIIRQLQAVGGSSVNYQIYKHYPKGRVTTLDCLSSTRFYCVEKEEKPQWTLHPDTTTILNYLCQKATCHFKGRDWTAWYTLEVPVAEGPWKLYGLPGLILRAEDSRRHYRFECSGVEQCDGEQPISIPRQKGEQVSLKERNKMYEMYAEDLIGFITTHTPNVKITVRDKNGNPLTRYKSPYNPIELCSD